MTPEAVHQLIRNRRSIFPNTYTDKVIPKEVIQEILENANWAPTHRMTEPWRFKVLKGDAKKRLGVFLQEQYSLTAGEKFSEMKHKKILKKTEQSDTIIAICMQRDPKESVPEWEEISSVAMAVQNMWLSCSAYGIGCYWSSPGTIVGDKGFFNLNEGETCLGLLYMGYPVEGFEPQGKRKEIADKVEWM